MAQKRPTMKDVAELAEVSVSTVSYVLNNTGPVAADRRARVHEAIRTLNYVPNASARKLKRGSSSTIGLVIPDLANQFFALLAKGVERAASKLDVLVVLCSPETTEEAESDNARLMRSHQVDGVVYLSGFSESPRSLLELTNIGPVVQVDERISGIALPAVLSDTRRGAREIARHVYDFGHKRVAVIAGPAALWTSEQRLAGYREACASAGFDPDDLPVLHGDYRERSGFELAARHLIGGRGVRPTALLCANDLMAIGAVEYCRNVGLRVPDDVSVVGFDDIPVATLLTPKLTTVSQDPQELGFRAATLLINLVRRERGEAAEVSASPELVPVKLQIRESVARPAD